MKDPPFLNLMTSDIRLDIVKEAQKALTLSDERIGCHRCDALQLCLNHGPNSRVFRVPAMTSLASRSMVVRFCNSGIGHHDRTHRRVLRDEDP